MNQERRGEHQYTEACTWASIQVVASALNDDGMVVGVAEGRVVDWVYVPVLILLECGVRLYSSVSMPSCACRGMARRVPSCAVPSYAVLSCVHTSAVPSYMQNSAVLSGAHKNCVCANQCLCTKSVCAHNTAVSMHFSCDLFELGSTSVLCCGQLATRCM